MADALQIRRAVEADLDTIITCIKQLADYEKMASNVSLDPVVLREELFGMSPVAYVFIAEWEGQPCGFALYFYSFSTFLGKRTIYLEDLYVDDEFRGKGAGKALIMAVIQQAHAEGCERVDWQVLGWNVPSIAFYEQLGAKKHVGWEQYRLDRDAIKALVGTKEAA